VRGKLNGEVARHARHAQHSREDPREDVARVGRVGEDVTRMLRGCYEQTAPVEFQLIVCIVARPSEWNSLVQLY